MILDTKEQQSLLLKVLEIFVYSGNKQQIKQFTLVLDNLELAIKKAEIKEQPNSEDKEK